MPDMTGHLVLLSTPTPRAAYFPLTPKTMATLVGALAIPLWATWPLLAVLSTDIPLFQFLTIIFGVGAALLYYLPQSAPEQAGAPKRLAARWMPALMVALGLLVSDILFIYSLRFIPPAQANLILYLWPVLVVLLAAGLGLLALRKHHLVSVAIGLVGVGLVVGAEEARASWEGISLAAGGGLAWAGFVVYRVWQGEKAPDALAAGFGLSAAISLVLHLMTEQTVVPPTATIVCTVLVGVLPLALGNLAWDYGIRRGDRALLAVMAYATPLVSALILVASGFASPTLGLLLGGVMIVAAGVISARSG